MAMHRGNGAMLRHPFDEFQQAIWGDYALDRLLKSRGIGIDDGGVFLKRFAGAEPSIATPVKLHKAAYLATTRCALFAACIDYQQQLRLLCGLVLAAYPKCSRLIGYRPRLILARTARHCQVAALRAIVFQKKNLKERRRGR